jgi:hypothetical protein
MAQSVALLDSDAIPPRSGIAAAGAPHGVRPPQLLSPSDFIEKETCRSMGYTSSSDRKSPPAAACFCSTFIFNKFKLLNQFSKAAPAALENWHAS